MSEIKEKLDSFEDEKIKKENELKERIYNNLVDSGDKDKIKENFKSFFIFNSF
jgi:hypothetical protein